MPQGQRSAVDEDPWPHSVTDDHIRWAALTLGLPQDAFLSKDGADPRRDVLTCMETIDVAACPGSGKTTVLVAKLAILAERWHYRTRGICVLSHTNVARREIEARLGNTSAGRALLSYPHFVGTIHAFVNEFMALPRLRSLGYPIKLINTEISQRRRWSTLSPQIRSGLDNNRHGPSILSVTDAHFGVGALRWGKGNLGPQTPTYSALTAACRNSIQQGYHCYEEMFVWANDLLSTMPKITSMLRGRFPLLFVDEAQDNSEEQSSILYRVFMQGAGAVTRQRFGDANQAIFNFVGQAGATTDPFPDDNIKRDLPNSHRFGEQIAHFANPLGLCPCGLAGHGPKHPLVSGATDAPHTLFLFGDERIALVLDAYADVLLETFSDEELCQGSFVAVGQVHKDGGDDHRPRHVGHYWSEYDPELAGIDPTPRTFVQHVLMGQATAASIGEAFPVVEKIAQGLLRLAVTAPGTTGTRARRHSHRYVLELLECDPRIRSCYSLLLSRFAFKRKQLTRQAWATRWRDAVRRIGVCIAGTALSNPDADAFLEWPTDANALSVRASGVGSQDNIYRYCKNGREVAIRCGSIHSVKGETHTGALVAETYWHDHNLESIKAWLLGDCSGADGKGVRIQGRLKLHYVAMTRPTHLMCLAMKKSTFLNTQGELDAAAVAKLAAGGWRIKDL